MDSPSFSKDATQPGAWRIESCNDVDAFRARAQALLERDEAKNCLMLGILGGLTSSSRVRMAVLLDERGDSVAALLQSRLPKWIVTELPAVTWGPVATHLTLNGAEVGGLVGPRETVVGLGDALAERLGRPYRVQTELRVFQCSAVIPPSRRSAGRWRPAEAHDSELLAQWLVAFCDECRIEPTTLEQARASMPARLASGGLRVWETPNGEVVSVASATGPTPNGIRISFVYTPHAHRGSGYASETVAALTQEYLDSGRKLCFLFTDLLNPTSNRIYQNLGYRPVADHVSVVF